MKDILIVGLGGFVGSAGRYTIYMISNNHFPERSFIGTLSVNLIGCLLIGILGASITKFNSQIGLFLMAGLCGGFTTFSSFALDGLKLLKDGMYQSFLIYSLVSVAGGLFVCFAGFFISNKL